MGFGYLPRGLPPSLIEQGYGPTGRSVLVSPTILDPGRLGGVTWERQPPFMRNRLAGDGQIWPASPLQFQAPY
jgi:hypothetical protein